MGKRVWKPLDVGGLRLYKVELYYWYKAPDNPDSLDLYKAQQGHKDTYIVASTAPRHAARYIESIYKEMYDANERIAMWNVYGFPLNVSMPKDWDENGIPCLECEPERFASSSYRG